ncbi:MAG: DUF6969 family protein [Candidatus Rokuibacteriota bacterium]
MTDAKRLVELLVGLEREGRTVMDLIRAGQPVEPWRLYPGEEGIFDRQTRCQFYYHAHGDGRDEDGHFHTVRLFHDRTVHLVGISMALDGWPRALFTVNYWAIGDAWEPAEQIKIYARRFRIDEARGPAPVVCFVNLVFRLFLGEIERLQEEKMAALAAQRLRHPAHDPFQDRSLEILSWTDIDLRRRVGTGVTMA